MGEKHIQENLWWVSPYNFADEVRGGFELPEKVEIHDATLRDGEQTPGVVFRKEDKVRIAQMLDEVGVERIEAGMPAVSEEDFAAIKEITGLGLKAKIFTFARAMTVDIDKALECGAHGVVIEIPIGYPKLKYQFGWTWEDVLRKSIDCINYAKKRGLYTVYFPYDTTRAREEDLTNLLTRLMQVAPPDSIGVIDTMGCAFPDAYKYLVKKGQKAHGDSGRGPHAQRFRHGRGHGAGRRHRRRSGGPLLRQRSRRTDRQCGDGGSDGRPASAFGDEDGLPVRQDLRAFRARRRSLRGSSRPTISPWSARAITSGNRGSASIS